MSEDNQTPSPQTGGANAPQNPDGQPNANPGGSGGGHTPGIPPRPQRGLGRGLSALLSENGPEPAGTPAGPAAAGPGGRPEFAAPKARDPEVPMPGAGSNPSQQTVPIELIRRNPKQPRKVFLKPELDELAQSIRERGIIQPVLVRPLPQAPGEFELVAGERRWRAAQQAGLHQVPVVVRELDDATAFEIAVLENVQRQDLNPVEEAHGYYTLMQDYGRTQDEIAQTVGKSRSHVANMIRLLSLPAEIQSLLVNGQLTAGHARALATTPDPMALAKRVVEEGLSVRETERLAKGIEPSQKADDSAHEPPAAQADANKTQDKIKVRAETPAPKDADTLDLERNISESLGLAVDIQHNGAGVGKLVIEYKTLEQLDEICRRLSQGSV